MQKENELSSSILLPETDQLVSFVNAPVQRYFIDVNYYSDTDI